MWWESIVHSGFHGYFKSCFFTREIFIWRVCESVSDPLFAVRLKAASFLDLQAVIRSRCRNTVPHWKPYLKARGILTRYDNLRDRSELVPTCSLGESGQRFVIAQGDKGTMTLARKIPSSFVLSLSIRYLLDILLYRDSYLRILFPSLVKSKRRINNKCHEPGCPHRHLYRFISWQNLLFPVYEPLCVRKSTHWSINYCLVDSWIRRNYFRLAFTNLTDRFIHCYPQGRISFCSL